MEETTTEKTIKIPENCSAGKLLALVHQCRDPVYLTGDGLNLCLTSLLCRYVAVDKIIKDTGTTQTSLVFTKLSDYKRVSEKIEEITD